MNKNEEYYKFLRSKINMAPETGFDIDPNDISPILKPHQRNAVLWAIRGGRRALFESFGLGKTIQQLEICRVITEREGGKALIVCPLGVKQEFTEDAKNLLGIKTKYVRTQSEVKAAKENILLTNYERVRDGDIDPKYFTVTSLDEASVLRSFGSKTYQTFLDKFKGVQYKFVCTATPSPNKYKELIHYAGYLEVMDTGLALTRFFQRDSTKANNLTLYPHKEQEFWLWMSSWALFITSPADLGYDSTGYDLPEMKVIYHEVKTDHSTAGMDKDGQVKMFRDAALGLKDAAKEKRDSLKDRIAMMKQIIDSDPESHYVIWHDLEAERHEIKRVLPEASEVYGSLDIETREQRIIDFANGRIKYLATKPSISGQGCNFQRHCHKAIFTGIGYEFNDFIQAVHRIYRFLQTEQVEIHVIHAESEGEILKTLQKKWQQHDYLVKQMTDIIKKNGLHNMNIQDKMQRAIGIERVVERGELFTAINNDCTIEAMNMPDNSVDLIHTSIPFSNHYEYTPSYNDFGHNEDNDRFFEQMDFLTPELLRILKPGRVAAIHVKDRVLFGNATGTGMPTIDPFHATCIFHYLKHGFQLMGMITVVTDVVRENNQTYRLGWSEQCKDGTKMGVGCPEYILLFRKLPTDRSKAYADTPVTKTKQEYSRARWQIDAHAFWKSSGNRLLTPKELAGLPVDRARQYFRQQDENSVYDYHRHVEIAETMESAGKLPATFMAVDPVSHSEDVWDDVVRMRTLNSRQTQKRLVNHVCLAEDILILTRDGYKPIQDISIGDIVLTHKGNWKPVIAKACTGDRATVQTKAQGVPFLITTPDHKLWTRTTGTYPSRPKDGMMKTSPDWIEAEKTVGCYVNLKLPQIEYSNLTENEWWLIGRYLADGHIGVRGDFFISVGKHKRDEFENIAKSFIGSYVDRETAYQYRLKGLSEQMKTTLRKCGHGASNKQVPIEGLCLNVDKSEALISGYLSGDGNKTGNATSASSVSRALLLGMAMVAQRARGVIASIFKSKKAGTSIIDGRKVNCKQLWVMTWRDSNHHHKGVILDDGAWKKVHKSIDTGVKTVWSIQVQDDASYTAEGCIVKNCPLQLDIVERVINRYSNPGELVFDPFGGIMTVPYMAVKMGRRGMATELNKDYFRDGLRYLREAESEVKAPTLFDIIQEEIEAC